MDKLVFATHNSNKLKEVRSMIENVEVIGLNDLEMFDEIEETAHTLSGNALLKADYIFEHFGLDCFADDSGLEIDALSGAPGVFSARYAGEPSDDERNIQKVLDEMQNISNRVAGFRTVLAYRSHIHGTLYFEGIIEGTILEEKRGSNGFGYDPIFLPKGYNRSFAEFSDDEKNSISHRALAIQKFVHYINSKCKQ